MMLPKREPNVCFKIWAFLTTWLFCLFVIFWVSLEFKVFRINTLVTDVHPGAGSCWAYDTPNWKDCNTFVFSFTDPGISLSGHKYQNISTQYHNICIGALVLAIVHLISTILHCTGGKSYWKFIVALHLVTLVCCIIASSYLWKTSSRSCGECIHQNQQVYMNVLFVMLTAI